jgi:hypothetical protein
MGKMFPNKVKKTFNNFSDKYGEDQKLAIDATNDNKEEEKEQSDLG